MGLFVIADTHLSFGTSKPMDVFSGWNGYVDKIKEHWEYIVSPDDTVVIAGDISWGMSLLEAKPDFEFLHNLPGQKILLKGNHDYWFDTKNKFDKLISESGFNTLKMLHNNAYEYEDYSICGTRGWLSEIKSTSDNNKKITTREAGRLRMSLEAGKNFGKQPIAFLHYPPIYSTFEMTEITDVLKEFGVKKCFYGHLHGHAHKGAVNGIIDGVEYALVSCDFTQFSPVKIC